MKSNTNELRKQLNFIFQTICKNVFYASARQKPRQKPQYPYLVFELSELLYDSGCTKYKLEVNCVSKNTEEVEDMADFMQDLINNYNFINEKIAFDTYRISRQKAYEEDKTIQRRRLIFELKAYSREE